MKGEKKNEKKSSITIFSLVFVMVCSSVFCNQIKATEIELKWKDTVDENGYLMQVLDMTEEEIEMYQIAQLKKKYESNIMQRTSGYTYNYEKNKDYYDTGDGTTDKILIGKKYGWAQRSTLTVDSTLSFELKGAYKILEGSGTLSATTSETYVFEDNYENCLGLFARIATSQYKITKIDKYTGHVISITYDNIMATMSKSVKKIYNKTSNKISYKNGSTWNTAKMIKSSLTDVPKSASDFSDATITVFN